MSVIVGRCEHGHIQKAIVEKYALEGELEEMASTYMLERVESVEMGGRCNPCFERYSANIKLLEIANSGPGAGEES